MVLYRELPRTAAFAWSPGSDLPIVATGTKAGVADGDFSNESVLELWDLNLGTIGQDAQPEVVSSVKVDDKFHDLDWASYDNSKGYIAGALQSGVVKVWDANKLLQKEDGLHYTSPVSDGVMRRVQFSPLVKDTLAAADSSGRLHLIDIAAGTSTTPVSMPGSRSIDAIDWNKKTATILATGDSVGTISIVRIDAAKPVLDIAKPVGVGKSSITSIAWDPEKVTTLAAGVATDGEYKLVIWDLRNTSVPVREILAGTLPINSLSWNRHDTDLLLSSSQDYQTCWNPNTGREIVRSSNDASLRGVFETRFHPDIPDLIGSASFSNTISILSTQNISTPDSQTGSAAAQVADADFFETFSPAPKKFTFSIDQAPKWLKRPVGAKFGFGGKLFVFGPEANQQRSHIKVIDFPVDSAIQSTSTEFEDSLKPENIDSLLADRITEAASEDEKAHWAVIDALRSGTIRSKIPEQLGFKPPTSENPAPPSDLAEEAKAPAVEEDDAAFFDKFTDMSFDEPKKIVPDVPFNLYPADVTPQDKVITKALISGSFDEALKLCQSEGRWTDAFMVAICGGDKCIQKVKEAYFEQNPPTNSYMRLSAAISDKNLQSVVANADLVDWKDIMVIICNFATDQEFPILAEALGDRLQATGSSGRHDATFCYLAGSKLEKVVANWIVEIDELEAQEAETNEADDLFSIHTRYLQKFIEKVTVFRKVTNFVDPDSKTTTGWKLSPLYSKYLEYADVMASVGKLDIAQKYLNLLPRKFSDVEAALQRVDPPKEQTRAAAPIASRRANPPLQHAPRASVAPVIAPVSSSRYSTTAQQKPAGGYIPQAHQYNRPASSTYVPNQTVAPISQPTPPPPPREVRKDPRSGGWNDMPKDFISAPQRPGSVTPSVQHQPLAAFTPPPPRGPSIPPPPKGSYTPSQDQHPASSLGQNISRPPSVSSSAYVPNQPPSRTASPYDPPTLPATQKRQYSQRPAAAAGAGSGRYAPSTPQPGSTPPLTSSPSGPPGFGPPPVAKPPIVPPSNPYAALAQSAPPRPAQAYGPLTTPPPPPPMGRPGSVSQMGASIPPPPKGPPPPRGPSQTTPMSQSLNLSSGAGQALQQGNVGMSSSVDSGMLRQEPQPPVGGSRAVNTAYNSLMSLWAGIPAQGNPSHPKVQASLERMGTFSQSGVSSPALEALFTNVSRSIQAQDYEAAKKACQEAMGQVAAEERIFVATAGKVLVAVIAQGRQI